MDFKFTRNQMVLRRNMPSIVWYVYSRWYDDILRTNRYIIVNTRHPGNSLTVNESELIEYP